MRSALARSSGNRVSARLHRIANAEESLKGRQKHCTARWRDFSKIRPITPTQLRESTDHRIANHWWRSGMKQSFIRTGPIVLGIAAMVACGGDSTSPSQSAAVGSYTAFQFVTTGSSGQTNQLLIGSTVQITLAANGTTSGHLHLAASGSQPAFDADLAGRVAQKSKRIEFTQGVDNIVNHSVCTVQP